MNLQLEALVEIMPPPDTSYTVKDGWEMVSADFGLTLPGDYREFIERYGAGAVGGELGVPDFRDPKFRTNWISSSTISWPGDDLPLPMYPAPGPSLFPLAGNGNGDNVFGITDGSAITDDTLWIGNVKESLWVSESGSLIDLLIRCVSGDLIEVARVFGADIWLREPVFVPVPP